MQKWWQATINGWMRMLQVLPEKEILRICPTNGTGQRQMFNPKSNQCQWIANGLRCRVDLVRILTTRVVSIFKILFLNFVSVFFGPRILEIHKKRGKSTGDFEQITSCQWALRRGGKEQRKEKKKFWYWFISTHSNYSHEL